MWKNPHCDGVMIEAFFWYHHSTQVLYTYLENAIKGMYDVFCGALILVASFEIGSIYYYKVIDEILEQEKGPPILYRI